MLPCTLAAVALAAAVIGCQQPSPTTPTVAEATATPRVVRLTISISPEGAGTVSVVPSPGEQGAYSPGTDLVLTADPLTGFTFVSWAGAVGGKDNPVTVTIQSGMSVVAAFVEMEAEPTPTSVPTATATAAPSHTAAPTAAPPPTATPTATPAPAPAARPAPVATRAPVATATAAPTATGAPARPAPTAAPARPAPTAVRARLAPTAAPVRPTPTASPTATAVPQVAAAAKELHNFYFEGRLPTSFGESPVWAEKVARGELPPIEQRLPREPQVIKTFERPGDYGGTWRRAFTGPRDGQNYDRISHDWPLLTDIDTVTTRPHIVDKWEIVDDKVFAFFIREGIRWSDGAPFTTEDFRFAHEEISYNGEINPGRGRRLSYTEFSPLFEVVDDYTFRYTFEEPTPIFMDSMKDFWGFTLHGRVGHRPYAPAHFVKKFHLDFGDRVQILEDSRRAGFSSWGTWFNEKNDSLRNVGLPTVAPWDLTSPITEPLYEFFRNPYYYEVDEEGNQLPYIDRISMTLIEESEELNLRAIAGEFDFQGRHIQKDKLRVFLQNQQKGNYTMDVVGATSGGWGFSLNQTFESDEEVANWMRNRDFRIALSHAIDREEINAVAYQGLATNQAVVPHPAVPSYLGPGWETKNSTYDPALSNFILDFIGLDKKDSNGMRLRKDGKDPLEIEVSFLEAYFQDWETSVEMVEG